MLELIYVPIIDNICTFIELSFLKRRKINCYFIRYLIFLAFGFIHSALCKGNRVYKIVKRPPKNLVKELLPSFDMLYAITIICNDNAKFVS